MSCTATTKAGNPCKVKKNLVDGLCRIHSKAPAEKQAKVHAFTCSYAVSKKNKEAGTTYKAPCGAAASDSTERCSKHTNFIVFANGMAVGPFKVKEDAERAALTVEGAIVVQMFEPASVQSFGAEEEEKKIPCEYVLSKGKNKGAACGKLSTTGFCSKHVKAAAADGKDFITCDAILRSGKKAGDVCGVKAVEGMSKCFKHVPKAPKEPKEADPAEEVHQKCTALLKSGKREGEECGVKAVDGTDKCFKHTPKEKAAEGAKKAVVEEEKAADVQRCAAVLKSGKREGEECGAKVAGESNFCKKHAIREAEQAAEEPVVEQKLESVPIPELEPSVAEQKLESIPEEKSAEIDILDGIEDEMEEMEVMKLDRGDWCFEHATYWIPFKFSEDFAIPDDDVDEDEILSFKKQKYTLFSSENGTAHIKNSKKKSIFYSAAVMDAVDYLSAYFNFEGTHRIKEVVYTGEEIEVEVEKIEE